MKNENKKAIRCAAVFAALAMGFGGCAAGAETNRGSMKLLGESGEGTAQVKLRTKRRTGLQNGRV